MPNDPPPDRILLGVPGSTPADVRHVSKIAITLTGDATSAEASALEEELAALLPCEVSVHTP